ncbi:MAG: hypothetical protein C0498_08520 [Anaerolinea sp.]|nr:hypothetical protein [Anaerolinea sp.]
MEEAVWVGLETNPEPVLDRLAEERASVCRMRALGASLAEGTTLFLSRYVLLAFSGLLGILEREKPPELDALLQRMEELGSDGPIAQERSR